MTTKKRNQHYIPKFYLRNFSIELNEKQIGIFNTNSKKFVAAGSLADQGSKKFFYGKDGKTEDWLSNVEGKLSTCIRNILKSQKPPERDSFDHIDLLGFVAITDLRNPVNIDAIKERNEIMKNSVLEIDPNTDTSKIIPDTTHEENIELALSHIILIMKMCRDLEFRLLINQTSTSFITSDVPVVRYNQFLERRKWPFGKTGFGTVGLQIIIPLDPNRVIFFYDPKIYSVGLKQSNCMYLTSEDDIDQLNLLQILNCKNNLFFNESITEDYLNELVDLSVNFNKANLTTSITYDRVNSMQGGSEQLIRMGKTDCEINLTLKGVRLSSGAGTVQFTNSIVMLRPHAKRIREMDED